MLALILSPKIVPNVSAYRPDYLFQEKLGVQRSYPCRSYWSKDWPDGLQRAVLENDPKQG